MIEDTIDDQIARLVKSSFDRLEVDLYPTVSDNAALNLLSIGELVDRLTIVNIKLYKLKDFQTPSESESNLAKSALADVALVKERANLKATISDKVRDIISRTIAGVEQPDARETKVYGNASDPPSSLTRDYINRDIVIGAEHSSANDPSVGRSPKFNIGDKVLIVRAKEGHYWVHSQIDSRIGQTGIVQDVIFDNVEKFYKYTLKGMLQYVPEMNLILREGVNGRVPTRIATKNDHSAYSACDVDPKYT